jgi:hypothetical protein
MTFTYTKVLRPPGSMLFLAENASPESVSSLPPEHLNILPAWHSLPAPRPSLLLPPTHGPSPRLTPSAELINTVYPETVTPVPYTT